MMISKNGYSKKQLNTFIKGGSKYGFFTVRSFSKEILTKSYFSLCAAILWFISLPND